MGFGPVLVSVAVAVVASLAIVQVLVKPSVAVKIEAPPGATPYSSTLEKRLGQALAEKGTGYEPRTRHLNEDGSPKFTNRLIFLDLVASADASTISGKVSGMGSSSHVTATIFLYEVHSVKDILV